MESVTEIIKTFFAENTLLAILKIISAVFILAVGFKLTNAVCRRMKKSSGFIKFDRMAQLIIANIIDIGAKGLLVVTAAAIIGVPMTSIIAVIGSLGLAVGLALQGGLANIAGTFILLAFKPFVVGDYIIAGADAGVVKDIGIFYSQLLTLDNKLINFPNGTLANMQIVNCTAEENRRVDLTFSVAYESDIDKVRALLLGCAAAQECALADPAPVVYLTKHGDSALEFSLRVWSKGPDYWTVYFGLTESVKRAFDANGVSIPFPQMDVHLDQSGK